MNLHDFDQKQPNKIYENNPLKGPDRDRAAPGLARAGGRLVFCIYFADFNLSGGCFPICFGIFYQIYIQLYVF